MVIRLNKKFCSYRRTWSSSREFSIIKV